jgi:hypothetical protein
MKKRAVETHQLSNSTSSHLMSVELDKGKAVLLGSCSNVSRWFQVNLIETYHQ